VSGTLYLVATPIGNLEDITFRAVRVLKEVDLIACEDTRQTRKLLEHFGIQKHAVSFHDHNEADRSPELLDRVRSGQSVAVVSDAGTPLIEDPGYRLVSLAVAEGIPVVPIPGPSSLLTALSASGLPTDSFYFGGFLPPKSAKRRKELEALRDLRATLIFFETPHRILESLDDVAAVLGGRPVVVGRELTKLHEEFLRGTASEIRAVLAGRPAIKGEMTLLIGKAPAGEVNEDVPLEETLRHFIDQGMSRMDAIKAVAKRAGLPKREVYSRLTGQPETD
jgi:16S rRNA (cytidine1402-2'-O)-methyltransferase